MLGEIRKAVKELMQETCMTQTELRNKISRRYDYNVASSDMSNYLSGKIETPKAKKVLVNSLEILIEEKETIYRYISKGREVAANEVRD